MKKIVMIGLCLFFASALFILLKGEREIGSKKIINNSFIEGLKILYKKEGNVLWTLTARRADIREDENMADLSDITVAIQKNGMKLHAQKGTFDLVTRNFTINSEIEAESRDYRVITSSIDYNASSGEVTTDKRIMVEGKKFTVEGEGMTFNSEQKVRIEKDVKATFYK